VKFICALHAFAIPLGSLVLSVSVVARKNDYPCPELKSTLKIQVIADGFTLYNEVK